MSGVTTSSFFFLFTPSIISLSQDYNFLLVIEKIFSAMDWMVVSMAELFYHMKVKNVIIDFLLVIQIIGSTK